MNHTISIIGAGWLGTALGEHCIGKGMRVKVTTTTPGKVAHLSELGLQPACLTLGTGEAAAEWADIFSSTQLVIAVPPKAFLAGGLEGMDWICQRAQQGAVQRIVYISSTSVYPNVNRAVTVEDAKPDTDSGKFQLELEKALVGSWNNESVILRLGGLIGPGRHPGKFLAGKTDLPNGNAPVNLIHLDDCVAALANAIAIGAPTGIFHLAAPHHPTRAEFYTQAAKALGLPIPTFLPDNGPEFKTVEPHLFEAAFQFQIRNINLLDCI